MDTLPNCELMLHHEMCPKSCSDDPNYMGLDPLMTIEKGEPYWLASCPCCGTNIRIRFKKQL